MPKEVISKQTRGAFFSKDGNLVEGDESGGVITRYYLQRTTISMA